MLINKRVAFQLALAAIAGTVTAIGIYSIYNDYAHRADYLYWDPSSHAYYGVKLTSAFQAFNLLKVLAITNEQVLWPPLHSYLQVPFMLAIGKNFFASSICSIFFLALFFIALTYCYHQIADDWFGFSLSMILAGSSPYVIAFGSMPMLEIFGTAFTALSAALYMRHSKWFPLSLTFLFFLKYNYCIYVLLPIIVLELVPKLSSIRPKTRAEVLSLFTPFRIFLVSYIVFLIGIFVTGGFKIFNISVRGIGNPLYILYLLIIGRLFLKKQHVQFWNKIKDTGWQWFVVPVGLWLLVPIPNRIKTLVSFAINVPLSSYSPNELSFYTFYFVKLKEYFASEYILISVVILALVYALWNWRNRNVLFLVFLFVLPLTLMTMNQNKQERYLYTFVFSLWLLAAFMVSTIRIRILKAVIVLGIVSFIVLTLNVQHIREIVRWPFVFEYIDAPVDFIASEVGTEKEIQLLGVSNDMSPALLAYHIGKKHDFKLKQSIRWRLEKQPPSNAHVIVIERNRTKPEISLPAHWQVLNKKSFEGDIHITHFLVR